MDRPPFVCPPYPYCVFGSDSAVRDPSAQYLPHPRGCGTIAQRERDFGINLPESYKKFLRVMGYGPREFLECDHWDPFFPELLEMGQGKQYEARRCRIDTSSRLTTVTISSSSLMGNTMNRQSTCWTGDWYEKASDTFWDFFKEMVIYNEIYGKK